MRPSPAFDETISQCFKESVFRDLSGRLGCYLWRSSLVRPGESDTWRVYLGLLRVLQISLYIFSQPVFGKMKGR